MAQPTSGGSFDITIRRQNNFVLWIPSSLPGVPDTSYTPRLVLGKWNKSQTQFQTLANEPLVPHGQLSGLWEISCADVVSKGALKDALKLETSAPFMYWYQVQSTSPDGFGVVHVTDPFAYALDYRYVRQPDSQPASVIGIDTQAEKLYPCDHEGGVPTSNIDPLPGLDKMPLNDRLVIYELPTSFVQGTPNASGESQVDVGTFRDVASLFDDPSTGAFDGAPQVGAPYLPTLGVNVLELTPPADAKPPSDATRSQQEWGYATAHYFAPDYQLGWNGGPRDGNSTAVQDLYSLVEKCHSNRVRFFADIVTAFGHDPYQHIAFDQFHLIARDEVVNDDSYKSSKPKDSNNYRDDWGGKLWRYEKSMQTYDPETGTQKSNICPATSFHLAHLKWWISFYGIDGVRMDSIENAASWNFLRSFRDRGRDFFGGRYNKPADDVRSNFLVVGEELSLPRDLLTSGTLDGYWNEGFKWRVRKAIVGVSDGWDFGKMVREAVDCRQTGVGFYEGSSSACAVNYITSHDTGDDRWENKRLYNCLDDSGVSDKETRTKLAFAILLTSVGIPMIYAGEEFCDQQDQQDYHPWKQADPVNYDRLNNSEGGWRRRVFDYVARLVKVRTRSEALSGTEVDFIYDDFDNGKRIMAWKRWKKMADGSPSLPVIVVVKFSDGDTGDRYSIEPLQEVVRNLGEQVKWRDVSQTIQGGSDYRPVAREWVGWEKLYHWEAKVYEAYHPV